MIQQNHQYFQHRLEIAALLYKEGLYNDCLNYIEESASFAWINFSGIYHSPKLELLIEKISKKVLAKSRFQEFAPFDKRQILHICSEVYATGGHSKLLYNWINNDPESDHHIFATRMTEENLAEISTKYTDVEKIKIFGGLRDSRIETAQILRQILVGYDFIVLHIHPDDVVPNLVFSNIAIKAPLLFLNHADHVFWLGTRILDCIIQIRDANIKLDEERRGIPTTNQYFLPIPVNVKSLEKEKHCKNIVHLLSTGTYYKFKPNEKYNFLKEAKKIVEKFPQTIFHIVGVDKESDFAKKFSHERLICHGLLLPAELAELEAETDIYVEGFPMASFTALLQVALQKKPFILHYNALPIFQLFEENKDTGIFYPKNIESWHNELGNLISDNNYRKQITENQFTYILKNYSIEAWRGKLQNIYTTAKPQRKPLAKNLEEKFFNGANEELLVTIDKKTIDHYNYTFGLSFVGKMKVWAKSFPKNRNVHYFSPSRKLRLIQTVGYVLKG